VVNIAPELDINDAVREEFKDSDEHEDFLFSAATRRSVLSDRRDVDYTVKVHDFQSLSMQEYRTGGDQRDGLLYQIVMAEINALSTPLDVLIWDQDNWDSGKVWGV
jgi:hypothetical protein